MSDQNQNPGTEPSVTEEQHRQRVEQQQAAAASAAGEEPVAAGTDYEAMSADELSAEAERRGLAKSGSKAEVRARLEANDRGEA